MWNSLDTAPKLIVVLTAMISFLVGTWKVGDYLEVRPVILKEHKLAQLGDELVAKEILTQQQQLMSSVIELQFQSLHAKKSLGALDFVETQQYCKLAEKLGYVGIDNCI